MATTDVVCTATGGCKGGCMDEKQWWLSKEWYVAQLQAPPKYTDYDPSDEPQKVPKDQWGRPMDET